MAEKAQKQSPGKFFDICRKLMYILTIPFLIIILLITVITFGAKTNNGVPSFLGMQALKIEKQTMLPDYKVGDVVLIQKANVAELKVGDKIAYYEHLDETETDKELSSVDFNIIVAVEKLQNPLNEHYGKLFFQMQGINSETPEDGWIMEDYVVGTLTSQNGFMENFLIFASSMAGVAILAIVPALIEVALLVIYIVGFKKLSKKEDEQDQAEAKEKLSQAQQQQKPAEEKQPQVAKQDKQSEILEKIKTETKTDKKVEPVKTEPKPVEKTVEKPKVESKPESVKVEPKVAVVKTAPKAVEPAPAKVEPAKVEIKVDSTNVEIKAESANVESVKVVEQPKVEQKPVEPKKVEPAPQPKAPPAPPKAPPAPPKAPPAPPKAPPAPPKK